jgi:hypothetical protein
MSDDTHPIDRRTSLQWMLAAAALPGLADAATGVPAKKGYGTDPDLVKSYRGARLWPLTMTAAQRRTTRVLCDLIIPADALSPSAGDVGVPAFIDEWISAPYPAHQRDRERVLQGLAWLDEEAQRRFGAAFAAGTAAQQDAICQDICLVTKAEPPLADGARFFARFRDLVAGGFYTTPQGTEDLGFVGNRPSATFDGPPPEALRIVGVS